MIVNCLLPTTPATPTVLPAVAVPICKMGLMPLLLIVTVLLTLPIIVLPVALYKRESPFPTATAGSQSAPVPKLAVGTLTVF
ncbi:hypothetical protein [Rickettsia endosymbiont of Gonocerus acuteangulatus]|uniref:hypothetical protein n=1 Tax=Rickettsia endosymbiont of Gonocerus acuteangulatus TaxID=3066266 RepID=UPI00313345F0